VREYNAAVQPGAFNPAVKDGRRTQGITPPKSNWARPIDTPPHPGYAVTTGITFTFGGLRISPEAQVIDNNYPGGAGLMAGSVLGRIAGRSAATPARG
jgi:tricarballylate dehydrogenase